MRKDPQPFYPAPAAPALVEPTVDVKCAGDEVRALYETIGDPTRRKQAIELLRALAPDEATGIPKTASQPARSVGKRNRVLLVDDDSDILVSVGGFLEAEGIDDSCQERCRGNACIG